MAPKGIPNPFKKSTKGKSQELDWDVYFDEFNVGKEGWEHETQKVWTCTTCKKYITMSHIAKLWPMSDNLERQVKRWEGPMKTCNSQHFVQRYEEVWAASNLAASKPNIMNYSTMAMVWAEIVLQRDVDWRTVIGMNKGTKMTCHSAVILTNWTGHSDCMPNWSNRGQFGLPAWPMPDAEDTDEEDEEEASLPLPPPPPGSPPRERHERRDERDDIEYENQMREALRRSTEDYGPPRRHHASSRDSHRHGHAGGSEHGGGRSRSNPDTRDDPEDFPNVGGGFLDPRNTNLRAPQSTGSQYYPTMGGQHGDPSYVGYSGSQYGGSQYYPGTGGEDAHGPHGSSFYGGSSHRGSTGSEQNAPIPPPTFGLPYYGNYGPGGQSSGYAPHGGSDSTVRNKKDDSSSDSE